MKKPFYATLIISLILMGLTNLNAKDKLENPPMSNESVALDKATFAGGCFWCMEPPFEKLGAVVEVLSGYAGGEKPNPRYEEVSSGSTGHYEVIELSYDPSKISYEELLDTFWRQIDPTDDGGSFVDRGPQYKSAIFYHNQKQKMLAEASKERLSKSGKFDRPIATEILPYDKFYAAEEYHQDYYKRNPIRYKFYRSTSGRDRYIEKVWGKEVKKKSGQSKPSEEKLRKVLTPLQYKVTQEEGTEKPFSNEYWDNKAEGIYVDIVSGEPLFSSVDKYDSGTGWPSFTKPLEADNIIEREDNSLFMKRIEVRSKAGGSHLGHLFPDGPEPKGDRYCLNSAALRFIPKEELEKAGLGKYLGLFKR